MLTFSSASARAATLEAIKATKTALAKDTFIIVVVREYFNILLGKILRSIVYIQSAFTESKIMRGMLLLLNGKTMNEKDPWLSSHQEACIPA